MYFRVEADGKQNVAQLRHSRVVVLGAARSGVAAARLLKRHGATVLLSDVQPLDKLPAEVARLSGEGIQVETGGHSPDIFNADLAVLSPGIPRTTPVVRELTRRGIPVIGELEMAGWFCQAPVVAVTGSNGKTTTTALLGALLQKKFATVLVGGNIGTPLSALLLEQPYPEMVVVEVSSFQLESIVHFHPQVALVTNLSPNHLDWYPSFEAYVQAKMRIAKNLDDTNWLVTNAEDALLQEWAAGAAGKKFTFALIGETGANAFWQAHDLVLSVENRRETIPVPRPRLRGPHNRYNMAAAALVAFLLGVNSEHIGYTLEHFPGLPHRLEVVGRLNGITFVNDSKATTVESLRYALLSFEEPIVLIAGGKDKGGDFSRVVPLLRQRVRAVVVLGEARERILQAWHGAAPLVEAPDLEQAVQKAFQLAMPGDVVLMAPGCASFDMFRDYEERGNQFRRLVQKMIGHLKSLGSVGA